MRMLYWGSAAAGIAALGLWFTARYAMHHPDSVASCCFKAVYHAGIGLWPDSILGAGSMCRSEEDEAVEIPLDPEPVADAEFPWPPNPVVDPDSMQPLGHDRTDKGGLYITQEFVQYPRNEKLISEVLRSGGLEDLRRGRLPGKIIIDDGEELSVATPDRLAPEPNLDRIMARIEAQWKSDDAAGTDVTTAFWQTTTEYVRPMPFCDDGDPPVMPPAADPDLAPRKKEPPRIWFPFMPKGTEVGGDEKELSPNGNDCREDPSIPLQQPGCLNPKTRESKKIPTSAGEEVSEPQGQQNKKSRPIEEPKTKRISDPSKLQPFAAPVKLDTMEFRPSDWGKHDVAVPPF